MANAILIPADVNTPVRMVTVESLEDFTGYVGGMIEAVTIPDYFTAYLDEEGKLKGRAANIRAHALLHLNDPSLSPWDVIVGYVVVVGPADASGDDTDAPESLCRAMGLHLQH